MQRAAAPPDPVTAWLDAARSGVVSSLATALPVLLASGATAASAADGHGLTALHHAVLRGHEKACRHLLAVVRVPADVVSGSNSNALRVQMPHERVVLSRFTPLHAAALGGNVRCSHTQTTARPMYMPTSLSQ